MFIFFFKQKTAYEMRISDWSSDVCSSDLLRRPQEGRGSRRPDHLPAHAGRHPGTAADGRGGQGRAGRLRPGEGRLTAGGGMARPATDEFAAFAAALADAAGPIIRGHFRTGLTVDTKADASPRSEEHTSNSRH